MSAKCCFPDWAGINLGFYGRNYENMSGPRANIALGLHQVELNLQQTPFRLPKLYNFE